MKQNLLVVICLASISICFSCGRHNTFSDSQGNVYRTVKIGQQEWTTDNLLLDVGEGSYCYDDDPKLCEEMGRLYTWSAARVAAKRIAGWHLPSKEEWEELTRKCGDDSVAYNNIISDSIGFHPQWSGVRVSTGEYKAMELQTVNYWSSSAAEADPELAYSVAIMSNLRIISPHNYPKANACSVRLVKDR
jgi:uncharacterized protein (TIGR02145 family)